MIKFLISCLILTKFDAESSRYDIILSFDCQIFSYGKKYCHMKDIYTIWKKYLPYYETEWLSRTSAWKQGIN